MSKYQDMVDEIEAAEREFRPVRHDPDPPQQWNECLECNGSGIIARRVSVYEHGCGFSHSDTSEEPCISCNGAGGWLDDAEGDR